MTTLDTERQVFTQCTNAITAFNVNEIQSADLSLILDAPSALSGVLFVSATYETLSQQKDAIYAFSLGTNLDSAQSFDIITPISYIDFGVDPSVKVVKNNDTLFILEVDN